MNSFSSFCDVQPQSRLALGLWFIDQGYPYETAYVTRKGLHLLYGSLTRILHQEPRLENTTRSRKQTLDYQ